MKRPFVPLAICILSFGALFATLALLASMHASSNGIKPNPELPLAADEDGFPAVDWDYWKSINPDLVGWISIPDTAISLPVVSAPVNDPQKYLTHDVYGNWSYLGCPYLDADCTEKGLEHSPNIVILAHNLGYGDSSMFAPVANFTDSGFMTTHRSILLQTPEKKMRFSALAATCAHGSIPSKRTDFENPDDLIAWLNERISESQTALSEAPSNTKQALTLCTCSYNHWDDERTILFSCRT